MTDTETIIEQYIQNAPKEIVTFLADDIWRTDLTLIAQKAGLDQTAETSLANHTVLLILGITTIKEYPSDLAKDLGLSREEAERLTKSVFENVLGTILPIVEAVSTSTETPATGSEETTDDASHNEQTQHEPTPQLHNELIIPQHLEPMIVPKETPAPIKKIVPTVSGPTMSHRTGSTATQPAPSAPAMRAAPGFIRTKTQLPQARAMVEPISPATPAKPKPLVMPAVAKVPVAPANLPTEPTEPSFNRNDILGDIENPMPIAPANGATLKNPMPLYDQKLSAPVRSPRQEQKIVTPPHKADPYREEF